MPKKTKGVTRGTIFREVARQRLDDTKTLFEKKRYNGAVYLSGYAIECLLKYAYCKRKNILHLPESLETHRWDDLVHEAGLVRDIKSTPAMSLIYDALAEQWGPSLRYRSGNYPAAEASKLYNEMIALYGFLNELVP